MENIKSYLDGELDLAQQTEVETHLRNDADLQRMADEFRSISDTLKTANVGEPYGLEKLEKRLAKAPDERKVADKKIWRLATWWSVGTACAVLLALMCFPIFAQSKVSAKRWQGSGDATASSVAATPPSLAGPLDEPKEEAKLKMQDSTGSQDGQPQMEGRADGDEMNQSRLNVKVPMSGAPIVTDKVTGGGFGDGAPSSKAFSESMPPTSSAKSSLPEDRKSEPESDFKSNMRSIRDQRERNPSTLNDTPHGIYLERSGQVQVKVEDLMRSVDEATGMVQSLDGFVVNHELQNEADGGAATMMLRVPTKNFNAAMNKLQEMGEVISVNSSSQDITTETVDNGARMISWADEEKRLVDALAKAKNENEKWRIRQQLANVRANLESYRAVVKSLKKRSEYSTINVTFLRGDKADKVSTGPGNWSGTAFKDAKSGLGSIGQVLGVILIYAGVFTPVWLPFLIAFLVIRKRNQ